MYKFEEYHICNRLIVTKIHIAYYSKEEKVLLVAPKIIRSGAQVEIELGKT